MLQDILLCLAGYSSPLLRQSQEATISGKPDEHFHVSPPERALLSTVAHLSDLHINVKRHAASICISHRSTICKAVASAITNHHLQHFLKKIVEVERAILSKDASYVGGYGIVPLSAVVGEFAPWTRRLEWLWQVVRFILRPAESGNPSPTDHCTGPSVMNFLRKESQTGYTELEEMALELVKTAEMAWLRQLSAWVLYGKLPASSSEDFFIKPQPVNQTATGLTLPEFLVQTNLVPDFVLPETASSILFIGQSLNQVRACDQSLSIKGLSPDPALKLLPAHLMYLKAVEIPISSLTFANLIASIRLSTSQNALSQLLPVPQVLEVLHVLKDFLLLGRGEFATSFISNADKRVNSWHHGKDAALPVRKAGRLDRMRVKEGDLAAVLSETWSELVALRVEGNCLDDTLERGREILCINCRRPDAIEDDTTNFSSLLFSSPTSLTLSVQSTSPLALFLNQADILSYSEMNSYLLGIRRAEMHLASLWKHSSLRRCHPSPMRLSSSGSRDGELRLAQRRKREDERHQKMRRHWAIASKSQFVLSELGGYFQSEIVDGHWRHFLSWLNDTCRDDEAFSAETTGPGASTWGAAKVSGTGTGTSPQRLETSQLSATNCAFRHSLLSQQPTQSDPTTLAKAHQRYLSALHSSLLMNETGFTKVLLDVMILVDHFVALFGRLQVAHQNLDLEMDEGVVDVLADHRSDEQDILDEMERSRHRFEEQLGDLVKELRDSIDRSNAEGAWVSVGKHRFQSSPLTSVYTPWRPRNIDGLLMKLELVGVKGSNEGAEDDDENEIYYSE